LPDVCVSNHGKWCWETYDRCSIGYSYVESLWTTAVSQTSVIPIPPTWSLIPPVLLFI
jgi:hypothetical protein